MRPDGGGFIADARHRRNPGKAPRVTPRHGVPRHDLLGKDFELFQEDRRLNGIEPAGDADTGGVVFVGAFAVNAQAAQAFGKRIVVGENGAAVAVAAERLGGKKAGRRRRRERAELAGSVGRAKRLRCVVEHLHAVRGGKCGDSVVIGRQAEQIDGNDSARL